MQYFLDTNTCVALLKGNKFVAEKFSSSIEYIVIPSLVAAELYKGACCSQRKVENLSALEKFLELLPIAQFDLNAARIFGEIQAQLRSQGKPTGEVDALIAAIALKADGTIVTNNTKHFENIPGLKFEDWLRPQ